MPQAKKSNRTAVAKRTTRSKTQTARRKATAPIAATKTKKSNKSANHPKTITHHAKRLWHMTPKFVHGAFAGAFVGILLVTTLGSSQDAGALSISAPKDCDGYSIIECGVQSSSQLQTSYNKSAYVRAVYSYFTISSTDMANIGATAVKGIVYKDGTVKVNGKLVATKARTAARKQVVKTDIKRTSGSNVFYTRYLTAGWSHTSGSAYVVMKNGVFDYAVLASCGNPIVATAIKPKPTPVATPPTTSTTTPSPTPTPPPSTPIETPPETTPTPTPVPQPEKPIITTASKVTTLPNTGPGAVIVVLTLAVLGGYIFHRMHHHLQHRKRFQHLW